MVEPIENLQNSLFMQLLLWLYLFSKGNLKVTISKISIKSSGFLKFYLVYVTINAMGKECPHKGGRKGKSLKFEDEKAKS